MHSDCATKGLPICRPAMRKFSHWQRVTHLLSTANCTAFRESMVSYSIFAITTPNSANCTERCGSMKTCHRGCRTCLRLTIERVTCGSGKSQNGNGSSVTTAGESHCLLLSLSDYSQRDQPNCETELLGVLAVPRRANGRVAWTTDVRAYRSPR